MVRREGFLLLGASNHVTSTTDSTYESVLSRGQGKEIFRFNVSGMETVTGPMTMCSWKPVHAQVREKGEELAHEYDDVRHLDKFLQPNESLLSSAGGIESSC